MEMREIFPNPVQFANDLGWRRRCGIDAKIIRSLRRRMETTMPVVKPLVTAME